MVFTEATLVFLHAHAQMVGVGGIEGGWENKSQAHLLVSASFFSPLLSIFIIELDSLNATDESAARGGGEKMRADRTAGCQRVLGEDIGGFCGGRQEVEVK